ncbi:MAG TPA: hypothetical protein VHO69_11165 [Phototrophicaceae bacterium]|nr:hypothetical protein [Phototrophicaceae bacterium]
MLRYEKITVAVTGAAGAAVGSARSHHPILGRLCAIYLAYTGQPTSCDVTITQDSPAQTLLSVSEANTNTWKYPKVPTHQANDGSPITDGWESPAVCNHVQVSVAQGNPGTVTVTLLWEEGR